MKNKTALLVALLFCLSFGLIGYRVLWLHYPLLPNPQVKSWQLGLVLRIEPESPTQPVRIQVGLPQNRMQQVVIGEQIHSGPLDVQLLSQGENRIGTWSGTVDTPQDTIGYDATIVIPERPARRVKPPFVSSLSPRMAMEDQLLLQRLAEKWRTLKAAARLERVVDALGDVWRGEVPAPGERAAWQHLLQKYGRETACHALASAANLPARQSEGLPLAEGSYFTTIRWIAVWVDDAWVTIDSEGGRLYGPREKMLPLSTDGTPVVSTAHAQVTDVRWTMARQIVSPWRMHLEPVLHHGEHFLTRWSLFTLPPEFQTIFRIILLVPLGALMVSILRNVVGFPSFGIFMPVLMALAFRTTGLLYGLMIFAGIILAGYGIRRWIDDLHLLLVPRLSVVLTVIISCFVVLALVGNKLGLRNMMAVGLLPFVILTLTVERFYVLIEESGARQALLTSVGSAAVSVLTYFILEIERLQLLFFVFPELLLAVGACQILLGRYTGYRLSEYIRFRGMRNAA